MWNTITTVEGRQYLQIADGSYVEIAMQPCVTATETSGYAEIVQSAVTCDFLQPTNSIEMSYPTISGSFLPAIDATTNPVINESEIEIMDPKIHLVDVKEAIHTINNDESDVEKVHDSELSEKLSEIIIRLERIEPILEKVVFFMADVDRYMNTTTKQSTIIDSTEKKKFQEDYSEFEGLFPINKEEQLLAFESSLNNQAIHNKLFNYFESVYNLNGKRDSSPFFKTLLRKILVATTMRSYSWKGQSRNNKGSPKTLNKSFKDTFPLFIKFIHRVVRAADYEFTEEHNNDAFSIYLRNKNTEIQRHERGGYEQRVARVRRTRTPKSAETVAGDIMELDESESMYTNSMDSNDSSS